MIGTVEYLTRRRRTRRRRVGLLAIVALLFAAPVRADGVTDWHAVGDIAQAAESFVLQRAGGGAGRTSARAAALDPRLRLAARDAPLTAALRPGARVGPRTVVAVSCEGTRPWRLFVPVEVTVRSQVWTVRHPLPRGHLLTAEDLVADERDVIRLRTNFRQNAVHLYPIVAAPEQLRELFVAMLTRANELTERPEFYNTLTSTCTTNIVDHINDIAPKQIPFSYKLLLPGYSDELAYDLGLISNELTFAETQSRHRIDERARKIGDAPNFSKLIRTRNE